MSYSDGQKGLIGYAPHAKNAPAGTFVSARNVNKPGEIHCPIEDPDGGPIEGPIKGFERVIPGDILPRAGV